MNFHGRILTIYLKDLSLELRSRDVLAVAGVFSLLTVLTISFAMDPGEAKRIGAVGGLAWVTLLFASGLTMGRSTALERENGCMEMLLTIPGDRAALFVGKTLANATFMLITAALVFPAYAVMFHVDIGGILPSLALVAVLGALAIAAPATLLSTMILETRGREMLLPILLLPMEIPAAIACVEITKALIDGDGFSEAGLWLRLLIVFDLLFTVVPAALYDRLVEG